MHLCLVAKAKARATVSLTAPIHISSLPNPLPLPSSGQLKNLLPVSTPIDTRERERERKREVIAGMSCIKILLLVSLIPLALRGASLLGDAVVPSPSPDSASGSTGVLAPVVQVEQWRQHQRRRIAAGQNGRATVAFAPRRFGGAGFFRDDKRFAPTGSNPLHNL
uniref:Uncharacterized protein n=1 Tax=Avena sativa TaxID=4498 RepID=A0ACD5W1F5_AVESA